MSLISIVQDACDQIQGLSRPTEVAGSTDPGIQQMARLLNLGGRVLARDHDWGALVKIRTFTGVAAQAQTGEPPAAFDRFVSQGQVFNTATDRPLIGAKSQNYFNHLTLLDLGGTDFYWTLIAGVINITPTPTTSNSFKYAYVSKYWVRPDGNSDDANDTAAFANDTDASLLNEELHTLDLVWRWKHAKGLDYAEDQQSFEREKQRMIGRDRAPHMVTTAHDFHGLPENMWPYTIG
jgi:hypothetical protein